MIHRTKIPGWAKDARRTLATFIVSNARFSSANYHMPDLTQAVENIPKAMGDVKDQAIKLTKYITEPTEELPGLRNFLFFNFIGGSIASSVVNLSQVPMVAYPYLSQFGAGKAAKAITRWMRPGAKPMDAGHEAAIKRAEEEGHISPQEIHNLMATARGGALGGGKVLSNRHVQTALYIWGSLFSVAEQYNRRVTFNSAYQIARENGEKNPYDFAVKAVDETQFVYNRGNRPNWARGIGAPLFTFKQFTVSYLEMLNRLPARQKAIAISLLIVAAGIQGLPFEDDLEDLIDTLAQWGGYNWSTRKEMEEFARKTIGKEMTLLLMRGAPSALGVPLDIQSRLGFGNLIPGTAMLKPSETNRGRDVAELFGPTAGVVQGVGRALEATAKGEPGRAAFSVAPKAVRDLWKGVESSFTGEYRDASGKLIAKIKPSDAAIKALGFNPTTVSDVQRKQRMVDDLITLYKATESGIADKLARGLVFRDTGLAADARRELADWNRKNPEYPIRITPAQIQQRARQLTRDSSERLIKQVPKEIRGGIRNALS